MSLYSIFWTFGRSRTLTLAMLLSPPPPTPHPALTLISSIKDALKTIYYHAKLIPPLPLYPPYRDLALLAAIPPATIYLFIRHALFVTHQTQDVSLLTVSQY